MNTTNRSLMAACIVAAFAAPAAPVFAQHAAHVRIAQSPTGAKLEQTGAALRDLWVGHIFWVRNVAVDTFAGNTAAAAAAEKQVVANAKQIAAAIEPYYGKEASQKLFDLLAGHYGAVKQYLEATAAGSKAKQEAEDAVQEAYLQAFQALGSFRAEARLSTWLVRIAVNQALGRLRKRSADVIPLDSVMDTAKARTEEWMAQDPNDRPESAAERAELRKLIEARIDKLPEAFRPVFVLRAVEELTVEETAAALGISEATVWTRFFRARSLLREGLSRDMDMAYEDAFSFDGERCDRIVERVMAKLNEGGNTGCW